VHGDKRGRELGYPTANLRLEPSCELRHGIYAVRVGIGNERYDGVASFGRRPMFDVGTVLLEVFLFNFSGDLYGRRSTSPSSTGSGTNSSRQRRGAGAPHDEDSRVARIALARSEGAFPQLGDVAE